MSIKRTKQRTGGSSRYSGRDDDDSPFVKPAEPEPAWADIEAKPADSFQPFSMETHYTKGALILHSKFGKGVVLSVEGARIEVLFQDGKKKLGHAA
jgi:hypothetical protein